MTDHAYHHASVNMLDKMGAPYESPTDVDALRTEFGLPGSIEIHQAVVLPGGTFFFDRRNRFVGYACIG